MNPEEMKRKSLEKQEVPEIKSSIKETSKKEVLIVEDSARIRRILTFYLSNQLFEIKEAQDGATAFKLLQKNNFDFILLDIMLPDIDGFEICNKIKSDPLTKNIPVIFLTAKGVRDDVVKALKVGADDYIVKPFRKEVLLKKIKKFFPELGEPTFNNKLLPKIDEKDTGEKKSEKNK